VGATSTQGDEAQQRDVFMPSQGVLAVWAMGARYSQIERARFKGCGCGFGVPLGLQHQWQAVNHHVEKAANHQAQQAGQTKCQNAFDHVKTLVLN
jgi:hypothetical protein